MASRVKTDSVEINILSFSDEVLIHICSFLTSADRVSLSCSCQRFNDILCERKLVRCVNLRAAYSLTPVDLRSYFLPVVRCENVDTISLASCYWLSSCDLFWVIVRLTNLRCLHVNDTNLNIEHLTQILRSIKSIENLSWSFLMTMKAAIRNLMELSEYLHMLKSLNLWTDSYLLHFLPMLLKKCSSLEAFQLTTDEARGVICIMPKHLEQIKMNLPNLSSFVLDARVPINGTLYKFIEKLLSACTQDRSWKRLWLNSTYGVPVVLFQYTDVVNRQLKNQKDIRAISQITSEDFLSSVLESKSLRYLKCGTFNWEFNYEKFRKSSITHLLWVYHHLPNELPPTIQHLRIPCKEIRRMVPKTFVPFVSLPHLTCISVPVCVMLPHNSDQSSSLPQEEEGFQKKSNCKSHCGETANRNCFLKVFTEVAPNVRELEMKCHSGCKSLKQDEFSSLVLISRWSELETLFLECVPIIDFSVLLTICSSCQKIRRLGLKNVGTSAEFSQTSRIAQAIKLLEDLEDFQFVEPVVDNLIFIVNALSDCRKLRRVSIICEDTTSAQNLFSYLRLVFKCSNLVFLHVRVASICQKMEEDFYRALEKRFLKKRHSLWASFQGTERDDFSEDIPHIHSHEMIIDPARLTIIPDCYDTDC